MMELAGTKWSKCLLLGQDLFHRVLGVVNVLVPASAASAASVKGSPASQCEIRGIYAWWDQAEIRSHCVYQVLEICSALSFNRSRTSSGSILQPQLQRIPKDSKERIPKDSIKQPETFTFAVMPGPTMLEWMAGTVSDHKPQGRGKRVLTYFINICKQYANMQTIL